MSTLLLDRTTTGAPTPLTERRPPPARLTALEIRKSLSTRSGLALTATAALLPAVATLVMLLVDDGPPGAATMLAVLGTLVAMLLIAVGVLSTAGEWTHGSVQTTFLTVPQRGRVIAAKYAAVALLGAALSAVVVATTFGLAAIAAEDGFSWAGAGSAAAATIAAGAVLAVVGAGIGAAAGNAPAALTGTYLTLLVVINVLNGVKPVWGKRVDPLAAMFDLVSRDATGRPIAILAGWLVVTAVAGAVITRRRAVR